MASAPVVTALIEDEPLAAERLEKMLHETKQDFRVVAKLDSIASATEWLGENSCDLIFLDIHLSDGISFRIFDKLKVTTPIIFTTAYDQYAIRAFKLNSIDYLLKPVDENELAAALEKFNTMRRSGQIPDLQQVLKTLGQKPEYQKRFLVNAGQKIRSIETGHVAFLYAEEKIVILQTAENASRFPLDYTLDRLEEILDPEKFFRVNRKLIVNIDSIRNMFPYSKGRIVLELQPQPDFETVVSIDRAGEFKRWLNR
jgi:DNA-binding LytR/AlgR family response regulator